MYQLSWFQDPETLSILRIFTQPVNMIIIMINLLGLLYLFHHLGMKNRQRQVNQRDSFSGLLQNERLYTQQDTMSSQPMQKLTSMSVCDTLGYEEGSLF